MRQASEAAVTAVDWALSPLVGISQIFVVQNALSGALILGGIAVYSKEAAAHTLLGSSIGVATGVVMGADPSAITAGLWGFNPALTSLAVSVFFTPSCASLKPHHSPRRNRKYAAHFALSRLVTGRSTQQALTVWFVCVRSWDVLPLCGRRRRHFRPSRRHWTNFRCVRPEVLS